MSLALGSSHKTHLSIKFLGEELRFETGEICAVKCMRAIMGEIYVKNAEEGELCGPSGPSKDASAGCLQLSWMLAEVLNVTRFPHHHIS